MSGSNTPASTAMNDRPRVLVVPSSYFARERTVGGGERYAFEYARALARLTPTTLALFDIETSRRSVDRLEIRTFEVREAVDRSLFPLTAASRRELGNYDVVHLMVFPTPLTDLLVLLSRVRRQKLVLTDVGGGVPSWSTYLQKVHPRLSLSRLADGLALLSEHSASQYADWRQPKVLLYGGAAAEVQATGVGEYALFVGRLLPHKGVLPLIEAIGPDTPLHLVGRPYDTAYLERLKIAARGKRVSFFLDADDAELERQYAGARVVIQPSIPVTPGRDDTAELLGLVTLEGMAHVKPVIVTRTASLPELVVEGETGFVVSPGDAEALRTRIETLMADPELSSRMGAAAKKHVDSRFTWDRVAARGLAFYEALGAPTRGAGQRTRPDPEPVGPKGSR